MKNKLLLATLALLMSTAASAADLKVGVSADFPPWESIDASGEIIGFDRDFGDEVCKRIAANCTWSNQAFDGLLPSLQIGKFDVVISGISITEERAKKVDFSTAYADAPNSIVILKTNDISSATTIEELTQALEGKIIGVQGGTTHEQVVSAHYKKSEVRVYDRPEQIIDDIIAGRLDAGLNEHSAWETFVKKQAETLAFAGPLITSKEYPEFGKGQGIAIRKGKEELRDKMSVAIKAMLADGTLAKISQKWFGYDVSAK